MRTLLPIFVFALCATVPVCGQAIRFDSQSTTTSASCVSGKQCPLLVLPGTQVNFCQGTPATLSACLGSPATTYRDASAGIACATTSQLTPATGGACLSTADAQGGYGAWFLPGSYGYYLRVPATAGGGTYGPYPFSIHGDSGGYTFDSLYSTLAQACTAAGTGTLAITRAWNSTPSQTLACSVWFLGGGKIQTSASATVAFTGTVRCPDYQRCIDTTTNASGAVTFSNPPYNVNPVQWGADPSGSSNSAPAFQEAMNALHGRTVNFLDGVYLMSGSGTELILNDGCTSVKSTPNASLKVATGVGSSTDVMRVLGPCSGLVLGNYTVTTQSGTPARYGINLDATSAFDGERSIANFHIAHPDIAQLGAAGIATTFPTQTNGIFDGVIDGFGIVRGGIRLDRAGDNIAIRDINIPGTGPGFYVNLVPGAGNLLIEHNSITTCSGAVYALSALKIAVNDNIIEPAGGCAAPANGALIDFAGTVANPILRATTQGNEINGTPGAGVDYLIRNDYVTSPHSAFDMLNMGTGAQYGVLATANSTNAKVLNPSFIGAGQDKVLIDQSGSGSAEYMTSGISITGPDVQVKSQGSRSSHFSVKRIPGQSADLFNLFDENDHALLSFGKGGDIVFPYSVANSILPGMSVLDSAGSTRRVFFADPGADYILFGYQSAATMGGGGTLFYANGSEKFRLTPAGKILIGKASPAGSEILGVNGFIDATGYSVSNTPGFTGVKVAGACTFSIVAGIITNVAGC